MGTMYESLLRPILFSQDPERAHDWALMGMRTLGALTPVTRIMEAYNRLSEGDPVHLFGLQFPNAVGLAAGFDKNAEAWKAAAALGFGHVEIGTITWHKQPGNSRPRLFRLPEHEAIINRMGFNNEGAEAVAQSLLRGPAKGRRRIPLGINIGKSKVTPLEQATGDYLQSFSALADHADYFTINVSSPNTPELRRLQEEQFLPELLGELHRANADRARKMGTPAIPLLLKIAPDLSFREIDRVIETALDNTINGLVATNTTIARPREIQSHSNGHESGGLSGRPLHARSVEVINYIHRSVGDRLPVVGSGGVMDEQSAGALMDAGARLVQIYTGMIYRGPFFPKFIARSLSWRQREWV